MKILLFYGAINALNHFTDNANAFLKKVGCETFICTLPLTKEEEAYLEKFIGGGIHVVIMYDGIGMCFRELYDQLGIPVVNILVDHPMTFWHCMTHLLKNIFNFQLMKIMLYSAKNIGILKTLFSSSYGNCPVL